MANKMLSCEAFENALIDYYTLLDKNYPEKETLKLVGDRYRLTGVQRTILFRGITAEENVLKRKAKQIPWQKLKGKKLYIDGYNVLFTIMNYLLGKMVFMGNDGITRDSGGNYGKIENEEIFFKSGQLLVQFIDKQDIEQVSLYLDQPVSNSRSHKKALEKEIPPGKTNMAVYLVRSVDKILKQIHEGVLATSDSEIIAHTPCKILDLAREILETTYGITILDLGSLIKREPKEK